MADLEKTLYSDIAKLLEQARKHAQRTANSAMVYTYYEIGRESWRKISRAKSGQAMGSRF